MIRSWAKAISSAAALAIACRAHAAVTYLSQSREVAAQFSTLPPLGITISSTDLGSFSRIAAYQRLVHWNGLVYFLYASATTQSNIAVSGISAFGDLQAGGTPIVSPPLQGPISTARVRIESTFTVDTDTPFHLIASALPVRPADRFLIELKDASGNDVVHIDNWPDTPVDLSGTLIPGQYSFRYLAELNSGASASTSYSVALMIPSPASLLVVCALLPRIASRRR